MSDMVTERHNIAIRILLEGVSKGPLGAGLASMDICSADRLALQDLQIPEFISVFKHSTNRTLPKYILPCRFPEKQRLASSCPDAISVVPMKRVPRTNSRYPLRNRGGHGRHRERSAPATASPPTSEVCHHSQLLPGQRHVHLVEVKYYEGTRPKNQLEASKQQHHDLCRHLSRTSAQVILHTLLLGVGGVIYTAHTLEPLEELGLDTHTATKLALKLHAHSVQYVYKLASTRRALENSSKTYFNSHHQDQAWATAIGTVEQAEQPKYLAEGQTPLGVTGGKAVQIRRRRVYARRHMTDSNPPDPRDVPHRFTAWLRLGL
eukprot:1152493-Pelagomonas_calceolata.AAC.5